MDFQKFLNASMVARESTIKVPELADFFPEGEKAEWTVRGLNAGELARAREATDRTEQMKALVAAMAGDGDKAASLREAMGLSDDEVPGDVSRRIEMLAAGSVSPVIGSDRRDIAVKLAEAFPVTFYNLTNKIQELTGQGAELGKPKRSGRTTASA